VKTRVMQIRHFLAIIFGAVARISQSWQFLPSCSPRFILISPHFFCISPSARWVHPIHFAGSLKELPIPIYLAILVCAETCHGCAIQLPRWKAMAFVRGSSSRDKLRATFPHAQFRQMSLVTRPRVEIFSQKSSQLAFPARRSCLLFVVAKCQPKVCGVCDTVNHCCCFGPAAGHISCRVTRWKIRSALGSCQGAIPSV